MDISMPSARPEAPENDNARATNRPAWLTVALIALCVAGAGLFLYATPRGYLVTTPDSAQYLAASRSWMAGDTIRGVGVDRDAFIRWPPLFPLILSGLATLTNAPSNDATILHAVRVLNALTFGLVLFVSGLLFMRHVRSGLLILAGVGILLLAWPLWLIHLHAWSEPLFTLLALLLLLALPGLLERPSVGRLVIAGLIVALACLQRYLGFALIGVGGLSILLLMRASLRRRLIYAAGFGVIAALPIGLWLARNYLSHGSVAGRLYVDVTPERIGESITSLGALLTDWFLPGGPPALGLLLVGALLVFVTILWLRQRNSPAENLRSLMPAVLLDALYLALLAYSFITLPQERSQRMVAPLFPPTVTLLLVVAEWIGLRIWSRRGRPGYATGLIGVGLILWFAQVPGNRVFQEISRLSTWCCRDDQYVDSALVAWLRANPPQGSLWSDEPYALQIHTGLFAFDMHYSDVEDATLAPGEAIYVILFDEEPDVDDAVAERFEVELVTQTDDDAVFRLTERAKTADSEAG